MTKLDELIDEARRLREVVAEAQARLDVAERAVLEERFRDEPRYAEGDIVLIPRKLFGQKKWWPAKIRWVQLRYTEGLNPNTEIFGDEAGQIWSHQEIVYTVFLQQKDGSFGGTSSSFYHSEVQAAPEQEMVG